jgi:L-asparaginase
MDPMMSYSASALSFMLENLINQSFYWFSITDRDLRTDAKENLITAIQIASLQETECLLLPKCVYILNINYTEKQNN